MLKSLKLQLPPIQPSRKIFHGHEPLQARVIRGAGEWHPFDLRPELANSQKSGETPFLGYGVVHLMFIHLCRNRLFLSVVVLLEKPRVQRGTQRTE